MQINRVGNSDDTNFMAIKYCQNNSILRGNITKEVLASIKLKEVLENSRFYKLLGAQTDVFISADTKKLPNKINGIYPYMSKLITIFKNPYENSPVMREEISIEIPTVTSNISEFAVRLEDFLKKMPDEYHILLMDYRNAGEKGMKFTEAVSDFRKVFIDRVNVDSLDSI